jgi:hypothetical protein
MVILSAVEHHSSTHVRPGLRRILVVHGSRLTDKQGSIRDQMIKGASQAKPNSTTDADQQTTLHEIIDLSD